MTKFFSSRSQSPAVDSRKDSQSESDPLLAKDRFETTAATPNSNAQTVTPMSPNPQALNFHAEQIELSGSQIPQESNRNTPPLEIEIEEGSNLHSYDSDSESSQIINSPLEKSSPSTSAHKLEADNESCSSDLNCKPLMSKFHDLLGCVKNLLRITASATDFQFLVMEPNSLNLKMKVNAPYNSDTLGYVKFIRLLMKSHSKETVQEFCGKLNVICRSEFAIVKKCLVFFWKWVLCVIETKFAPGESEVIDNFLTKIIKLLDEINEKDDLAAAAVVEKIRSSLMNSNNPYHWRKIFQKEDVLNETMGDDAGRAAYCKFIRRLHFSHSEESVHEFCDEISQAICNNERAAERRDIKKRLLVFRKRVYHLIVHELPPGEAKFSPNLLSEVRQIMNDTFFNEINLIPSSVKRIIKALEAFNNQCNLTGIFHPNENIGLVEIASEEIEVRVAYIDLRFLLKLETSEYETQTFCDKLHTTLEKKRDSDKLSQICILFWKRVLSFSDDIPTLESGADCSNQIMDTILDLLDDTFLGGDISYLPGKILKNLEGCLNQTSLASIFRSDVVNSKPTSIGKDRLYYYRFIQRLKPFTRKEEIQNFCNELYEKIKNERIAEIAHTLVIIFWIKVECSIKDDFVFSERSSGFYQQLLSKLDRILKDTFGGDNCITKFSASHACCNCFCIQCATLFYEWYYKKVFRNLPCLRKRCPNILDKCCTPTCFIFSILVSIIGAMTFIFGFIYYFKVLILNELFQL